MRRMAVALAMVLTFIQVPVAHAITDPSPWQRPPQWCSLDSKAEFWWWQVAVRTADRGLMYKVCAKGVMR